FFFEFFFGFWISDFGFYLGSSDSQLPEAQTTIVGRHQAMTVDTKALVAEPRAHFTGEQRIEEHPAAENHGTNFRRFAKLAANRQDKLNQSRMKAPSDPSSRDSLRRLFRDGSNQGARIDDQRRLFALGRRERERIASVGW